MDYAELSSVFNINPYYTEPVVEKPVVEEPLQHVQLPQQMTCGDYEVHVNRCHSCMYSQARKRSNLVNLLIIFALLWIIFRK